MSSLLHTNLLGVEVWSARDLVGRYEKFLRGNSLRRRFKPAGRRLQLALGICLLHFITSAAFAGSVTVVASVVPHAFFGGNEVGLVQQFRNEEDQPVEIDVEFRLMQASSSTVMPLSTTRFKKLVLLPHQTVLEPVKVTLPLVKAPTRFLLQWRNSEHNQIGITETWVYPTNFLDALSQATQGEPIGLVDGGNLLAPTLRKAKVKFEKLQQTGFDGFAGKLIIVASFPVEETEQIMTAVKLRATTGHGIVWIAKANAAGPPEPEPISYFLPSGRGAIVAGRANSLDNFSGSPLAQLNLIRLVNLALRNETLPWSVATPSP